MRCSAKVLLAVFWAAASLRAQTEQGDQAAAPYTFHVESDLLQIPVLVLSESRTPAPAIDPSRFFVSVAGGKPFHPQVRREGDDAISLTVVIDGSEGGRKISSLVSAAAPGLVNGLRPVDTLAVDRLDDCLLQRLRVASRPQATLDRTAFSRAGAEPTEAEAQARRARCDGSDRLWSALTMAAETLSREPGRRVMLIVTARSSPRGDASWERLRQLAISRAVTVFAVTTTPRAARGLRVFRSLSQPEAEADPLSTLCELTGGLAARDWDGDGSMAFSDVLEKVRQRYILEFSSPAGLRGNNTLAVNIPGFRGYVRCSGVGLPLPPPGAATAGPSTGETTPGQGGGPRQP